MHIEPFALERFQSTWENRVRLNISESGVQPLRLEDLAESDADRAALFAQELAYTQTNGTPELRAAIAALYPGATADHVEVTNGGSEANCLVLWHLVQPGDEVVLMTPNYMQAPGLVRSLGATVREWPLAGGEEAGRWHVDLPALDRLVSRRTRVICVCNPNNPTGAVLAEDEMEAILAEARRVGAWILADEIYRGAERDGIETPSAWGRYERTLVTSGLSKAYGLPGLRIGWVAGPPTTIEALWGIHDYTSIAPGALNDRLARIALRPDTRRRLIERTRGIVRRNYDVVGRWVESRAPALAHVPPEAGAIAFVRYRHRVNSTALAERLRDERSVLVVPGDHFNCDRYLRIGFGSDPAALAAALAEIGTVLDGIPLAG